MGEREDNVYKAKLAEQAERYDGKKLELDLLDMIDVASYDIILFLSSFLCRNGEGHEGCGLPGCRVGRGGA